MMGSCFPFSQICHVATEGDCKIIKDYISLSYKMCRRVVIYFDRCIECDILFLKTSSFYYNSSQLKIIKAVKI